MIIIDGNIIPMKHYIIKVYNVDGTIQDVIINNPEDIDEIWDLYVANCTEGSLKLIDYDKGISIKDYDPTTDNR